MTKQTKYSTLKQAVNQVLKFLLDFYFFLRPSSTCSQLCTPTDPRTQARAPPTRPLHSMTWQAPICSYLKVLFLTTLVNVVAFRIAWARRSYLPGP